MIEVDKKSSVRVRNITAFSIFIMLVFTWIVLDQVNKDLKTAREDAVRNNIRILSVMSQQVELAFISIDNSLNRAMEQRNYAESHLSTNGEDMGQALYRILNDSPRVLALIMTDEEGTPLVAANKKGFDNWVDYASYSFAETSVFMHLKAAGGQACFIDKQRGAKGEGRDMIIVGKALQRKDGGFGGTILAIVDPDFFIRYFKTIETGSRSYISLQMADSKALLGNNLVPGADYSYLNEQVLSESQPFQIIVKNYVVGGANEIYGFTRLKAFPLVINVVLDEIDYLKIWRETRFKNFCFLAIFIVFGSLLSFFALATARQIVQVEKSEAAAVLASQAKSEFLANMSHELRTPLNAIIGFSEMMNSGYFGQLNPKQKERIHDINLCGSHLLNLITDILEFSKGDAGKLELVEETVIMQDIANESLRMMNKKIKEKQMNMIVDVDGNLPNILGDKRKIRQILLNLLSNSIKFTPEGGTVKVAIKQDVNHNVTMTVSDTGIGIAEKDIPVALSVFGQVHRNQSHEGTGLGLPLCKMFAELHGGRLAFGSTLGEGTTVRITFPASRNLEKTV